MGEPTNKAPPSIIWAKKIPPVDGYHYIESEMSSDERVKGQPDFKYAIPLVEHSAYAALAAELDSVKTQLACVLVNNGKFQTENSALKERCERAESEAKELHSIPSDIVAYAKKCQDERDQFKLLSDAAQERIKLLEATLKANEINGTLRGYDGMADELAKAQERVKELEATLRCEQDSNAAYLAEMERLISLEADNARLRSALEKFAKDEWPDVTKETARQALKPEGE